MSQGIGQLLGNKLFGKDDDEQKGPDERFMEAMVKADKNKGKNKDVSQNPAGSTTKSQQDYFSDPKKAAAARAVIEGFGRQADGGKNNTLSGDNLDNKTRSSVATNGGGNSLDKKNNNTEKKGPYVIDSEEKERQKGIIDSAKETMQAAKDKYNLDNLAASNESAAFEKANPKVVGTTKAERRRTKRDNKKAFRRANKSGEEYGTDQWDANFQAEKDLIGDRREKRKEYLRNFASQLTRGVQADQSDFKTKSDINFFKGQKADQANDNNKESKPSAEEIDKKSQIDTYENNFRNKLGENSDFDNSNFNQFLNLPKPELDTDRDSMGNNFMSEYFKKKNYKY